MQFTSAPVSTLYVKVNFKRMPYKREITALRIVAHNYAEFTANNSLMLVDANPDTVTLAEVDSIVESLRVKANALKVVVKMPLDVFKRLSKRG